MNGAACVEAECCEYVEVDPTGRYGRIINHDIDLDLLESIEKITRGFFMLPLEEKLKYALIPGTFQGYGQALVFSED
ncbi:hypothetical protein AAZX31_01G056400 [Glycine max]|uniref:Non-haem dioxygenase N-terminal domain-containing protein n=2 Tax=Glycine subgen. Soja TaxID=1462606 RepID=K7K253_SOYBN|nr:hypothetical protein JHK87_000617 [Glycine soja]KAG5068252.1 hypothetical protein JHK85_000629 [Glycine max]KAG5088000.1 hypothetical protein JHK86_000612 [Glycine max]KAH1161841.1 hypothetical protein GYH30_000637 [Glycine max]KAH1264802.1 Codeine O-demethylase [Glycine max]